MDNKLLILIFLMLPLMNAERKLLGDIRLANIKQFPYQVSIKYLSSHMCSGVILNEKFILTAAHCLYYWSTTSLTVTSGNAYTDQPDNNTVVSRVRRMYLHPKYNRKTGDNDIAVIEIKDKLKMDDYRKPAILNKNDEIGFEICTISGWGLTSETTKKINALLYSYVPYITKRDCKEIYGNKISDGMICTGIALLDTPKQCDHDSGGPLMCNNKIFGIITWGDGCTAEGLPTVYTKVAHYTDFIESIVNRKKL